ncbi:hypothetical protein ACXR6G_11565 [Ancylomarina sp. YFZ004]
MEVEYLLSEDDLYIYRDEIGQVIRQHMQYVYGELLSNKLRYRDRKEIRVWRGYIIDNTNMFAACILKLKKMIEKYPLIKEDLQDRIEQVREYMQDENKAVEDIDKCWFI